MEKILKCSGLIVVLFGICFLSCRKDFDYTLHSGNLQFSKDTVFLDTIFTNIGSSTYTLKVYNPNNEDVQIPFVGLRNGIQSSYRLNVDGVAGKEFSDIPILAKDSMFVFIETTFDIEPTGTLQFLSTDALQFGLGDSQQEIPLVTLVRDAVFLYPSRGSDGMTETLSLGRDTSGEEIRIEGFFLEGDALNFTNEKPYVIYGYAAVSEGDTLRIDAGARVHFHQDSGILVGPNASLKANGRISTDSILLENEIVFEGDRLGDAFATVPGQWGTIWLADGSSNNSMNHVTIKNATVGILVDGGADATTPTLSLHNTQIVNSSDSNLWARNTSIESSNTVLGNAGEASLYCSLGGSYEFVHTTIANYWNNGFRNGPALFISNTLDTDDGATITENLVRANFLNCIIDGNKAMELFLNPDGQNEFNFKFDHCLIQFNDTNGQFNDAPFYDFEDSSFYENVLRNGETDFIAPFENIFELNATSEARNQGAVPFALGVPQDILGVDRTESPDLGAYEYIDTGQNPP